MFEMGALLDDLRCQPTDWLLAERDAQIGVQRRARLRELAVTRVLDERGALDETVAAHDGVSLRTARETVECARALESLPEIAAAAHAGQLSDEQLVSVTQLADASTDREWALRAPNVAPTDLARLARTQRKPTVDDARARHDARKLRMWWSRERGMLGFAGELPDVLGAQFEATINQIVDGMRPAKGEPWDSREHRGADALVELCERFGDGESPTARSRPLLVVEVPLHGPAEIAGIPLPDAMVEKLRANAAVEAVLVDGGVPVAHGTRTTALSPKIARAVLLRDGHCRWPGCDRRTGLQVHHLVPRSWGGGDDLANLAAVCAGGGTDHHAKLVPNGPWVLAGNPNRPDGLRLDRHDQRRARAGPARARPSAA